MDKGIRIKKEKLKQQKRLKHHQNKDWMKPNQIGILKNHDIFHNNDLSPTDKAIYKRPKYKSINLEEE